MQWLIERPHIHVAFGRPGGAGYVTQPRRGQIETRLAVGECAHHAGSSPDLLHDALEWIVGPDLLPMNIRKSVVTQRLLHAAFDEIGGCGHPRGAQIRDDRAGLVVGSLTALLGMDGLEHMADLANLRRRHMAEDIAIKVHHAALPAGFRQILRGTLDKTAAGIGNDQPHALRPRSTRCRRNDDQPDLSSLAPSQMPRISRNPSELTAEATSSDTLRTSPAHVRFITMPSR